MEITIKRDTAKGVTKFALLVNNREADFASLSRELTGTTGEGNDWGVFGLRGKEVTFYYGDHSKIFELLPINLGEPKEAHAEFVRRTHVIREWVEECKNKDRDEDFVYTFEMEAIDNEMCE